MRLVTGGAPGSGIAEMWETIRDERAPRTWGEAQAFMKSKQPQPPSKAHIARLKRDHEPKSEKRGTLAPVEGSLDWFRAQLRQCPQKDDTPPPCVGEERERVKRIWRAKDNHERSRAGE